MASPPTLLAIDPGLRIQGAALFRGPELIGAALICADRELDGVRGSRIWGHMGQITGRWVARILDGGRPDHVCIEKMQIVKHGRGKWARVNPDDLLQLTGVAGAVAACCSGPNTRLWRDPLVATWKGRTDKEILWQRTKACLTPEELEIARRADAPHPQMLVHNTHDAICLGVWATGRLAKGGRRL